MARYYGGGAPTRLTGKRREDLVSVGRTAEESRRGRGKRAQDIDELLWAAFTSPSGGAEGYLPFFEQAAQGAAAPVLRDFNEIVTSRAANVAGRFGGDPTTEEQRVVRGTADDFSRNLTEALARVGPQAISASQAATGQMLGARSVYGQEEADFMSLLLQSALGRKPKESFWGKLAGTVLGTGANVATKFATGGFG